MLPERVTSSRILNGRTPSMHGGKAKISGRHLRPGDITPDEDYLWEILISAFAVREFPHFRSASDLLSCFRRG